MATLNKYYIVLFFAAMMIIACNSNALDKEKAAEIDFNTPVQAMLNDYISFCKKEDTSFNASQNTIIITFSKTTDLDTIIMSIHDEKAYNPSAKEVEYDAKTHTASFNVYIYSLKDTPSAIYKTIGYLKREKMPVKPLKKGEISPFLTYEGFRCEILLDKKGNILRVIYLD